MKSPYFLALLLAFVCSLCVTPALGIGDNDWRPVTPEEIAMKTAKVEVDADAEAIFWEVRIDDSSEDNLSMQHYVRVKIFTERGREKYSKFDIPFSKRMKIKDLAARVIKSDGSIVEVGKQDIIEREIVKTGGVKIKAKSIAMPALEVGGIVEYRYREIIDDAGAAGMHLKFQRDIPLQKLSYYYKPYNKNKPNYQSFNFQDTAFVKDEKGFWVATRTSIQAFKEEPHMPPEDQVIPWMLLQAVRLNIASVGAFAITFTFKDPSNPMTYWGAVGRERSEWAKFLTKPDKEIKRVATEITASEATVDAKLAKLYEFCQTQIRNTSYEPSLTDEERKKLPTNKSAADVLKNKTASSQFVDLLFGAMANSVGLETRVAFLATSVAAMQGRIAMWHFLGDAVSPLDLAQVSSNVFTSPEIATVGISQRAVDAGEMQVEAVSLPLAGNPRAKMQGVRDGFVKLFCRPGTGIIVGGVVVAPRASELIHPVSIAVAQSLTADALAQAFTVYPSMSGSVAEAARRLHHRPT